MRAGNAMMAKRAVVESMMMSMECLGGWDSKNGKKRLYSRMFEVVRNGRCLERIWKKNMFSRCVAGRASLCVYYGMAGNEAIATTNLTTLVQHISKSKASLQEQTRDFPGFSSHSCRLPLAFNVVRNQVP